MNFSVSESTMVNRIRATLYIIHVRYDFWFVYNTKGLAIDWEGGFELNLNTRFRNKYSIFPDNKIIQNWKD